MGPWWQDYSGIQDWFQTLVAGVVVKHIRHRHLVHSEIWQMPAEWNGMIWQSFAFPAKHKMERLTKSLFKIFSHCSTKTYETKNMCAVRLHSVPAGKSVLNPYCSTWESRFQKNQLYIRIFFFFMVQDSSSAPFASFLCILQKSNFTSNEFDA